MIKGNKLTKASINYVPTIDGSNIKIDSINFGMVEDFRKISNNVINL